MSSKVRNKMSVSKKLFRLPGLFVRSGGHRSAPSVSVCVQERFLSVLDGRIGAVCVASHANPLSKSRLLHSSRHSLSEPLLKESVTLSPAVRYYVNSHKISNLSLIPATGPHGRLLKG